MFVGCKGFSMKGTATNNVHGNQNNVHMDQRTHIQNSGNTYRTNNWGDGNTTYNGSTVTSIHHSTRSSKEKKRSKRRNRAPSDSDSWSDGDVEDSMSGSSSPAPIPNPRSSTMNPPPRQERPYNHPRATPPETVSGRRPVENSRSVRPQPHPYQMASHSVEPNLHHPHAFDSPHNSAGWGPQSSIPHTSHPRAHEHTHFHPRGLTSQPEIGQYTSTMPPMTSDYPYHSTPLSGPTSLPPPNSNYERARADGGITRRAHSDYNPFRKARPQREEREQVDAGWSQFPMECD
ncbi:hypothetical protein PM082_012268 [Marasmius tenuissimus]|nr:hypothetical protein PM082_012268 [Marasmius tenuissimus]